MKLKSIIFLVCFVLLGFFIDKNLKKKETKSEVALKYQERVERVVETDINKAKLEDFMKLGISMSKANKIIILRETVGVIENFSELERVKGFGEKTVKTMCKDLSISNEKIRKNRFEINNVSDEVLLWYGFTKSEIKKLRNHIKEQGDISSNLDLRKVLSEERYIEYKNLVIYNKY